MSQEDIDYAKRKSLWGEYGDAEMDRGDPSDPDYWSEERVANRERWRKGVQLLQDNVGNELTRAAGESGADADSTLTKLGFRNQKDYGKHIWGQFSNEGLYSTQGAAVDPNLDYDWARGVKTYRPGTENAGQSIPINATEKAEYAKAQQYRAAGLKGYGQMANAHLFQNVMSPGQFAVGPNGIRYNIRPDGTVEYKDQYGRPASPPPNFDPHSYYAEHGQYGKGPTPEIGGETGGPPPPPPGSYLPDVPGSQGSSGGPVQNYNQMWSGLATGQPAMPASGFSPAPTQASTRAAGVQAEAIDAASPYKQLTKQKSYGTGSWGATTPGGSNAGLKTGY